MTGFQILGWCAADAKESKQVMDNWGETDIRHTGAVLAFAKATHLIPLSGDADFLVHSDISIRINVQDTNRELRILPDDLGKARLHVMAYWSDWSVLYMGWQWAKVLRGRDPTKGWGEKVATYSQSVAKLREMSVLMEQVTSEPTEQATQGELL